MVKRTVEIFKIILSILVIFLSIVIIFSFLYFRYFSESSVRTYTPLSKELGNEIFNTINQKDIINGVQVVKTDLNTNKRFVIYTAFKDKALAEIYNKFKSEKITIELPVFTDDEFQNSRLLRIIQEKVYCEPYTNTMNYKFEPRSGEYAKWVCTVSIPSEQHQFKGIIVFTLTKEPSREEEIELKNMLKKIASSVYVEI